MSRRVTSSPALHRRRLHDRPRQHIFSTREARAANIRWTSERSLPSRLLMQPDGAFGLICRSPSDWKGEWR